MANNTTLLKIKATIDEQWNTATIQEVTTKLQDDALILTDLRDDDETWRIKARNKITLFNTQTKQLFVFTTEDQLYDFLYGLDLM